MGTQNLTEQTTHPRQKPMKPPILTTTLITVLSVATPLAAENLQHTTQLLSTKSCVECDLAGAGLVLADLQGANLRGANLTQANLSRANLAGADLTGANLAGASLNGTNLTGANLSNANLMRTDLRSAYLTDVNLTGVNIETAYIQGVIGLPDNAGTKEQFYRWATQEAENGNYVAANEHYNRALGIDPDFAPAYLGRAVIAYRFGREREAFQDAKVASTLFATQENEAGHQAAENFLLAMEQIRNREPDEVRDSDPDFAGVIRSVGTLLLRFLL
jgi:Flp pilus assembly protein TadD